MNRFASSHVRVIMLQQSSRNNPTPYSLNSWLAAARQPTPWLATSSQPGTYYIQQRFLASPAYQEAWSSSDSFENSSHQFANGGRAGQPSRLGQPWRNGFETAKGTHRIQPPRQAFSKKDGTRSRQEDNSRSMQGDYPRGRQDTHRRGREEEHSHFRPDDQPRPRKDEYSRSRKDDYSRSKNDDYSRSRKDDYSRSGQDYDPPARQDRQDRQDYSRLGKDDNSHPRREEYAPGQYSAKAVSKKRLSRKEMKKAMDPAVIENQLQYAEDYFKRNFTELAREDYPSAPESLFTDPQKFIKESKFFKVKSNASHHRKQHLRVNLSIAFSDGRQRISVMGDGITKNDADRNACKHAIYLMHRAGTLRELIFDGVTQMSFAKEEIDEEKDAKIDIYDYCARYDFSPVFEVREVKSRTGRPGTERVLIEVQVDMPQQNISVKARAKDRQMAELVASIEFKRQAEKWHAEFGDKDIIVKDISSLNSRNAQKFFAFYKMRHRDAEYDVHIRAAGGPRRIRANTFVGQMVLSGEPIGTPVEMGRKKEAEIAAYLSGAIALKQRHPELFQPFVDALRQGNGELLKPVQPRWLDIEQDCLLAMTDTILSCRKIGMETKQVAEDIEEESIRRHASRRQLPRHVVQAKNETLNQSYTAYLENPQLSELRRKKEELPMNQYRNKVLDLVNNNSVSIIVGATGSGKTTQVPQIILEEAIRRGNGAECNIICTQPRRIAATSVAQRVAIERNEPLQQTVGYHVRFDAKNPAPGGSITYCTTGILLQQLRNSPDETLESITHLLIDEVHERDILIDLLLVILKRILVRRQVERKSPIKLILMSATMDTELFAGYFKKTQNGIEIQCPSLTVPGRTFPVKELFLTELLDTLRSSYMVNSLNLLNEPETREFLEVERRFGENPTVIGNADRTAEKIQEQEHQGEGEGEDATINWKAQTTFSTDGQAALNSEKEDALVPIGLAAITVAHITKASTEGAILVFLPGLQELTLLDASLRRRPLGVDFTDESRFKISMLHSSIPTVQKEVFGEVPPGCRKVILATNIAETSVTIPDVQYVVDTGKMREKQYEQTRRITRLACTWISKSNSKQRGGRAGRVQNGNYYALFTKERYNSLRAGGLPEMLRSDLQEICLDIKAQGFKEPVGKFLSEAIEPPAPSAIEASIKQLSMLNALDDNEQLTPLGRVLATLPVEPALGKMILLGVVFRCLDPMLILGALSASREIFISPLELRREAQKAKLSFMRGTGSDHIAYLNAFREWREIRDRQGQHAAVRFTEENFLHRGALKTIDQTACQIEEILSNAKLIPYTSAEKRFRSELGHPSLNDNSSSVPLIKALTLAGMYPNLAVATGGRRFRTANENFTMIHPQSVNYPTKDVDVFPMGAVVTFSTKAKSNDGSSILLRNTTECTALASVLFGGKIRQTGHTLEVDGWLPYLVHQSTMKVTWEFRKCLDKLLHLTFSDLSRVGRDGRRFLADHPARETFARGLVEVFDRDVKRKESRATQGWGNTSSH